MADMPRHPGRILAETYMEPLGLSSNRLGAAIAVPANRVSEIIRGRRSISADTALRLAALFGTEAEYWMKLQSDHDLAVARRQDGAEIRRVVDLLRSVNPIPELPAAPAPGDPAEEAVDSAQSASSAPAERRGRHRRGREETTPTPWMRGPS